MFRPVCSLATYRYVLSKQAFQRVRQGQKRGRGLLSGIRKEASMAHRDVHVMAGYSGGWRVQLEGSTRAQWVYPTQGMAWEAAKQMARAKKVGAYLHGRDGQIRKQEAYRDAPTSAGGGHGSR